MKIETRYNCGDRVTLIRQQPKKDWIICGFCSGTGAFQGADGSRASCPKCFGRKGSWKHGRELLWTVDASLTVGQVRFLYTAPTGASCDDESPFDNFGPQREQTVIEYMAYETGIGTGTIWKEENLFPGPEAAQAECERRNAANAPAAESEGSQQ